MAEKVDRKQMTLAEAEFELTKLKSGAVSEGEKREAAESVASSQAAAAAAAAAAQQRANQANQNAIFGQTRPTVNCTSTRTGTFTQTNCY